METDAVGVDGPGDGYLLGPHGLPYWEAGVGVSRDFQEEKRRAQQGDFGRFAL